MWPSAHPPFSHTQHRWRRLTTALILFLVSTLPACASPAPHPSLQVAAAASLARAMPELEQAFTAETGITVVPVLSSSGQIAQQIAQGAPYDVFLSANEMYVDMLIADHHLIKESKRVYALGTLVLVTRKDAPFRIKELQDLTIPAIRRVAIANPEHAPYGLAAQEALEHLGIWEALQPKVVFGENVRQALQFVETGNADAALVARSLADPTQVQIIPVDPDLYAPVRHVAGIVSRTSDPALAAQFLEFLTGPQGRAILQAQGFAVPEGGN